MHLRPISYACFSLADHCIWILVFIAPDTFIFNLIKKRPWLKLKLKCSHKKSSYLVLRIKSLLKQRCYKDHKFSSCLSRCILGRIILDMLGAHNELHIGMTVDNNSHKIPHAWLTCEDTILTPGINKQTDCHILTF